ncbi:putative nucleolar and coiled-body phosphoprotein 1 [Paratrimastix pyriformis]|uniref:Nucleolar and coiled-body phosphoprotein 1 n=1 Tax=Paratrimastix pyriformis TaxID=342808 RepID=A0ABQ8USZ7_9EUKA|nr:putative nucleolar and coiled-body phosphoprotein 1 [Paratrimastix pyriformis]
MLGSISGARCPPRTRLHLVCAACRGFAFISSPPPFGPGLWAAQEDPTVTPSRAMAAPTTPVPASSPTATPASAKRTPNKPFQRVRPEEVEFLDTRLMDNRFEAKNGDSWGARASSDLIKVRGKGFRHEKTKKKRGTYRGGKIDEGESNSVKFHYDDDE